MLINLKLPFAQCLTMKATVIATICLSMISQTFAVEEPPASELATSKRTSAQTVVIVHGAWGGAHQWKDVAAALEQTGAAVVHRVTLTGQGERVHLASPDNDLSTHIQDVINVIKFEQLKDVVLIGHSYGGAVISGVANQISETLSQLIYLDSNLLEDGETFFSLMPEKRDHYTRRASEDGDGWLIPIDWEQGDEPADVPHQLKTLTSKLTLDNPKRLEIPSAYWLFADGSSPEKDERFMFLQRAKALKWQTRVFSWGHNPQKDQPKELAEELSKAIASQASGQNREPKH